MNRRKAITYISLSGLGLVTAGAAYKWWGMVHAPDLAWLTENSKLLASLCDTIIPTTDTPGARDAGVHDFIIKVISDCTPRKEQNTFISGLKDLQGHCRHAYGQTFESCTVAQQQEALARCESRDKPWSGLAGKLENRILGRSFFAILKEYTVYGYCTSQIGATQGMAYVSVPGRFDACIPLKPGQKCWATN